MKIKLLVMAMSLMIASAAVAQPPQGGQGQRQGGQYDPAQMVETMTNRLKEQLKLDDKQTAEVKKIYTEQFDKMSKLERGDTEGRTKLTAEVETKMKAILTEDQFKSYQQMMSQGGGFGGVRPGGGQRPQ